MTQTTVNRRLGFFRACCRGLLGGKAPLGAITVLSWWWWWLGVVILVVVVWEMYLES
jgi:hypothetical protein